MLVEVYPTGGGTHSLKTSPSRSKKQVVLSNLLPNVRGKFDKISFLCVFSSLGSRSIGEGSSVSPCMLCGDNSYLKNVWNMSIRKRLREKRPIKALFIG